MELLPDGTLVVSVDRKAMDSVKRVIVECDQRCKTFYEDAQPQWIPATPDTMPKEDGFYLIKMKTAMGDESVKVDSYITAHGEWFIYDNDIVKKWMPIPKEEGE